MTDRLNGGCTWVVPRHRSPYYVGALSVQCSMRTSSLVALLVLMQWPFLLACQQRAAVEEVQALDTPGITLDEMPLQHLLDSLGIAPDSILFVVDKSERLFSVLAGDRSLRTYPCVLGINPVGDKLQEGDRRTPEGSFLLRAKYPHKDWHKFVWIDYPNAESWKRFGRRKKEGVVPSNARVGGEIGIHGVPKGMDHWVLQGSDWTWGCIALRNADLDEIYPVILIQRTRLEIVP